MIGFYPMDQVVGDHTTESTADEQMIAAQTAQPSPHVSGD